MIYITGDTHGDLSHFKDPKLKRLGEKDIVIVCGDFGFLWDPNDPKEKRNLEWLKKRKYTICFLDGAHENFDMLDSYTPYRRQHPQDRRQHLPLNAGRDVYV